MIGSLSKAVPAIAILALLAVVLASAPRAEAATVESRFYLQVRNVTQGRELRLEVTNDEVLNLLVADIRVSGVAAGIEDDEVAVEGNTLVVRTTSKPRINLNLTVYAVCQSSCPPVLEGTAELPRASYGMLRTSKQDVTLTESGGWRIRLVN